jgi:hypothetical protein
MYLCALPNTKHEHSTAGTCGKKQSYTLKGFHTGANLRFEVLERRKWFDRIMPLRNQRHFLMYSLVTFSAFRQRVAPPSTDGLGLTIVALAGTTSGASRHPAGVPWHWYPDRDGRRCNNERLPCKETALRPPGTLSDPEMLSSLARPFPGLCNTCGEFHFYYRSL